PSLPSFPLSSSTLSFTLSLHDALPIYLPFQSTTTLPIVNSVISRSPFHSNASEAPLISFSFSLCIFRLVVLWYKKESSLSIGVLASDALTLAVSSKGQTSQLSFPFSSTSSRNRHFPSTYSFLYCNNFFLIESMSIGKSK